MHSGNLDREQTTNVGADDLQSQSAAAWLIVPRRHLWVVAVAGSVAELVVLAPFALIDPTPFFGMPGALATAVTILVALAGGLVPGLVTALAGGLFFLAYVTNAPHPLSGPAAAATVAIWLLIAAAVGFSADRVVRRLAATLHELRARQVRMQGTLESAAAAVGVLQGPDLRCEEANGRLRELFVGSEWRNVPLARLIPDLPGDLLGRLLSCASGGPRAVQSDEVDLARAGRTYALTAQCASSAGEPLMFLTMTDVSVSVRARRQMERLQDEFRGIAVAATPDEVALQLCRAALLVFGASTASFWGVDGPAVQLVARAPDPVAEDRWAVDELEDLADVIRSGKPLFVRDVHEHFRTEDEGAEQSKLRRYFKDRGYTALLVLPVSYGAQTGALLFLAWDDAIEQPDDETILVTHSFADEAAIAIERAQRLAVEREASELHRRLEENLLPRVRTAGRRILVEHRYVPGQRQMMIGGDFLETAELAGGSIALVIGDVVGHGPEAAALAAALRAAWHSLILEQSPPAEVLPALQRLLTSERTDPAVFATACAAWLDADRQQLTLSLAGHYPPLLISNSTVAPISAAYGPALGLELDLPWALAALPLPADWRLLFYTDGLLDTFASAEGRRRLGEAGVLRLLSDVVRDANGGGSAGARDQEFLERLLQRIVPPSGRPVPDDIALLLTSRSG